MCQTIFVLLMIKKEKRKKKSLLGVFRRHPKIILKHFFGLVVLAQIVSIALDGKCQRALLVAAKGADSSGQSHSLFFLTFLHQNRVL